MICRNSVLYLFFVLNLLVFFFNFHRVQCVFVKTEKDDWQATVLEVPAVGEPHSSADIPVWKFPKARFVWIL